WNKPLEIGLCNKADVRYADISPEVTLTNGAKFDLDINPFVYTLGYSYKF
ncbi:hypothetical protein QZK47_16760, partial [Acinetobacter baumannii]|nr:hypothetical protein [Acinetobacter baumannii]